MRRLAATGAAVLLLSAFGPAASGIPIDQGHIEWIAADDGWVTGSGAVDANGDGVLDVVTGAGDRSSAYVWCGAAGNPSPHLNLATDTAMQPAPRLSVLDGRDGTVLWQKEWNTGGLVGQAPERDRYELLEGTWVGDVDGDGSQDILVLRSSPAADGSNRIDRLELYDPRNGTLRWAVNETLPAGEASIRQFFPAEILGEPGAVLIRWVINPDFTFDTTARLLSIEPGEPPSVIHQLADGEGSLMLPEVVPYGDGVRIVETSVRVTPPPGLSVNVDVDVVDLVRDEDGDLVETPAWSRKNVNGLPVVATRGSEPSVVVGEDSVVAYDLDDGVKRWQNPTVIGAEAGGTMTALDVNGDGVDDIVASPKFGPKAIPDPAGLFLGGFSPEIVAIDGRTGADLWRRVDQVGKFGALSFSTADVDADGKRELVAVMPHQDPWPLCSQPSDDPGLVGVYELATGVPECRLSTDRLASGVVAANLNGVAGDELAVTTYGGRTYAFTDAEPGCGLLATSP